MITIFEYYTKPRCVQCIGHCCPLGVKQNLSSASVSGGTSEETQSQQKKICPNIINHVSLKQKSSFLCVQINSVCH